MRQHFCADVVTMSVTLVVAPARDAGWRLGAIVRIAEASAVA